MKMSITNAASAAINSITYPFRPAQSAPTLRRALERRKEMKTAPVQLGLTRPQVSSTRNGPDFH